MLKDKIMETALIMIFVILTIVLWTWTILDIIKTKFNDSTANIICLLVVLFFPVIGTILYFLFRKKLYNESTEKI